LRHIEKLPFDAERDTKTVYPIICQMVNIVREMYSVSKMQGGLRRGEAGGSTSGPSTILRSPGEAPCVPCLCISLTDYLEMDVEAA
jgi:hypothetical protein